MTQERLTLAVGTVMRTASANHAAGDGRFADVARFARALVYAMLQLKKTAAAVGVNVIIHARAAELDGLSQHVAQAEAQHFHLRTSHTRGAARGPHSSAKQRFIGIDISHTVQQLLVEQRAFDWRVASGKERGKIITVDGERLSAGSCKR